MRILVVEDEEKIAQNLKKGLELSNHVVDVALDGSSGLEAGLSEVYDVIILDWMLPQKNGLEVCQVLRQQKIPTPILFLTAKTDVVDRVAGLRAGGDDYLIKPFAFAELLARVDALARRPKQATSNVLSVGDLKLDIQTSQVSRANKPIALSRREFALLSFLMRNAGRTLSTDHIIEHVWNYESDVLPNTVQVYMGYLRNKIDRAFPNHPALIQTVRGFGYGVRKP